MSFAEIVAVVLGTMRVFGAKSIPFQAAAHLFVGGLIGAWIIDRRYRLYRDIALALTVLEAARFAYDRWPR